MGEIIKLHPREPSVHGDEKLPDAVSVEEAANRLIETVTQLIQTLEASHRRIRALIETIPDPETNARLVSDHAVLSAALRNAKEKAVALGIAKPDEKT